MNLNTSKSSQQNKRLLQMGELIRGHIALMLVSGRVADPRLRSVVIHRVNMSPDLQWARVHYTATAPDPKSRRAVETGLKKAKGFIRTSVGQILVSRYTPDISFHYDESFDAGNKVLEIMKELDDTATNQD